MYVCHIATKRLPTEIIHLIWAGNYKLVRVGGLFYQKILQLFRWGWKDNGLTNCWLLQFKSPESTGSTFFLKKEFFAKNSEKAFLLFFFQDQCGKIFAPRRTHTRTHSVTNRRPNTHAVTHRSAIMIVFVKVLQDTLWASQPVVKSATDPVWYDVRWRRFLRRFRQSWALSVFFHFFNNKKWFLFICILFKLTTYFCTSPI